jgi:hypothetical protein
MHAFHHPASRRGYGAALTAAEKEQYLKDVRSGKRTGTAPPRTAAVAESIRTGVPVEEILGGAPVEEEVAEETMTVSGEAPSSAGAGGFPWVWVVGGVVLLGGVGFAAWYFTRDKQAGEPISVA